MPRTAQGFEGVEHAGQAFFHGPLPLKPASMADRGSGAGLAPSSCATARACSGRVAGQGWVVAVVAAAVTALAAVAAFPGVLWCGMPR
jgi:hypothetical protein